MTTHYRYSEFTVGGDDDVAFRLDTFEVVKETPSGYWLAPSWCARWDVLPAGTKRWVSKTSRKRYCYPDKQEAWDSFKARKRWQAVHVARMQLRVTKVNKAIGAMPSPPEGNCSGMLRFI